MVSESQLRASRKYLEKFDSIRIRIPAGEKAPIDAHARAMGESTNTFVYRAIREAMERDNQKSSGDTNEKSEEG